LEPWATQLIQPLRGRRSKSLVASKPKLDKSDPNRVKRKYTRKVKVSQ
jgi:hypothetical protein